MSDRITVKSLFRDYHVHFIEDLVPGLIQKLKDDAFFLADTDVFRLYKDRIGLRIPDDRLILIEPREDNKTLGKCEEIIKVMVDRKMRRNHKLVAIGGGITQDVSSFVASILYRGVEWVFFPTTLLAQADSCIGGKTSINLGKRKNVLGNFYPPSNIYIDLGFLRSLSVDDVKSGIGEIMHFYLYADSPYLKSLMDDYHRIILDRRLLADHVKESLSIKSRVVEIDEFDKNERNKFNYGHTFGHAMESMTLYTIKHGQAVTVGMDLANYLSVNQGLMDRTTYERLHALLAVNFPILDWKRYDLDLYWDALSVDKKNLGGDLGCILSEGPGRLVKKQIPVDDNLKRIVSSYFYEEYQKEYVSGINKIL